MTGLELLPQRPEIFPKAPQGCFKFLFLEDKNIIDVRVIHEKFPRRGFHGPGQPGLGIRFFDGVGNRQRMNDVADGAELDDQDIHARSFPHNKKRRS